MTHAAWPALPLDEWEPTYLTLHRFSQVLGKVCLALAPPSNHWWHATLTVTPQGLSTPTLPHDGRGVVLVLDLRRHELQVHCSDGRSTGFPLGGLSVAAFWHRTLAELVGLGVELKLNPLPQEVADRTPLDSDDVHASYAEEHVFRLHRILLEVDRIFRLHRGRFVGKASPVQFFWGAFDLAVSRYSGQRNGQRPAGAIMGEAYSHEVIAHGFWPGGDWPMGGRVPEALFYAYCVPAPDGFSHAQVAPAAARFDAQLGEFVLPYEAVRTAADPEATLLAFMDSTYEAAARLRGWDTGRFAHAHPEAGA